MTVPSIVATLSDLKQFPAALPASLWQGFSTIAEVNPGKRRRDDFYPIGGVADSATAERFRSGEGSGSGGAAGGRSSSNLVPIPQLPSADWETAKGARLGVAPTIDLRSGYVAHTR